MINKIIDQNLITINVGLCDVNSNMINLNYQYGLLTCDSSNEGSISVYISNVYLYHNSSGAIIFIPIKPRFIDDTLNLFHDKIFNKSGRKLLKVTVKS